jgi:hypothetical protein
VIKVKVTVAKNRNSVSLNNLHLFWPIDGKLFIWAPYIKMQLGVVTQMFVIKDKVTVAKKRNSFFQVII